MPDFVRSPSSTRFRSAGDSASKLRSVEVARVPPYQVVEDRLPDLLVARVIEADIDRSLNPTIVVELAPGVRERVTSVDSAKDASDEVEWCDVYLSIVLAKNERPDEHRARIRKALLKVGERTSGLRRWTVHFYDASAAGRDVRYRAVVERGLMDQVSEHRPHPEQIDYRWSGSPNDPREPLAEIERTDFIADRAANERANREVRERMKAIERQRNAPVER